jgi:Excalibur calcium-binding domain
MAAAPSTADYGATLLSLGGAVNLYATTLRSPRRAADTLYRQNSHLDRDKDRIACEKA